MTNKRAKTIIWDFDGVIIFSDAIREKGFRVLYESYAADQVEQLLDFHRKNGGLSRYVKIRHFYETILGQEITDERVLTEAETFSVIMKNELTNKELLNPEWLRFMDEIAASGMRHFIASGSDQTELRFLCEQLGISRYFAGIFGSPVAKNQLVKNIIAGEGGEPDNFCLVGDAMNDYEAAGVNGISFFGYRNTELEGKGHYLTSFDQLKPFIYV